MSKWPCRVVACREDGQGVCLLSQLAHADLNHGPAGTHLAGTAEKPPRRVPYPEPPSTSSFLRGRDAPRLMSRPPRSCTALSS